MLSPEYFSCPRFFIQKRLTFAARSKEWLLLMISDQQKNEQKKVQILFGK